MAQVFLGIGTNIGNRRENIKKAIRLLREEGIKVEKISKIIETEPDGGPPQPKFLNAAVKIHTRLTAPGLLKKIKRIERDMGRVPNVRFGPRIIDLDILTFDNLVLKTKDLTIPHPRMWEREFVLKPLSSIIALSSLKRLKGNLKKRILKSKR